MDEEIRSIYIPDTNIPVYEPESVDILREGGNYLALPWTVVEELDGLKERFDIGVDAREAIRRINQARGSGSLKIIPNVPPKYLKGLNGKSADHRIIATARMITEKHNARDEEYRGYDRVVLISKDLVVRMRAEDMGINVEDYHRNRVDVPGYEKPRVITLDCDDTKGLVKTSFDKSQFYCLEFPYDPSKHGEIVENGGIVCRIESTNGNGSPGTFVGLRKGETMKLVPADIEAFGLKPKSVDGNGPNWSQYMALALLLDPDVNLVFLQGGAGTGKTLLAIACALEQRRSFNRITIARPTVYLDDRDDLGYLPGTLDQKMNPWKIPIAQALSFFTPNGDEENSDDQGSESVKRKKGKKTVKKKQDHEERKKASLAKAVIDRMQENGKFVYQPLGYIRGMNFVKEFVVVDDAQNLTPHQIKALITRADEKTKMVFTGDLGQIDMKRRLDRGTSGLEIGRASCRERV